MPEQTVKSPVQNKVMEYVEGRIKTVEDILSKKECMELIGLSEAKGYKPSPLSGGGHGSTGREGARTSQFCVWDDQGLSMNLWKRIKEHVPENLHNIKQTPYMSSATQGDEFKPVSINEHIRFYKYDPGQRILKHDDYRMSRYRYDKKTDKYYRQMTFFTVLVYLNDTFTDGETCFWTRYSEAGAPTSHCRFIRDIEFNEANLRIKPKEGMMLINDHMVQHEGEAPWKGTKYVLKTDIVHEKEITKNMIYKKDKIPKGHEYSEWTRHYEPSCLHYTE